MINVQPGRAMAAMVTSDIEGWRRVEKWPCARPVADGVVTNMKSLSQSLVVKPVHDHVRNL